MRLEEFKNKKITIIGLGLHGGGVAAAKFFSKLGARVLVTDLRTKEELKESIEALKDYPLKYVLGQHRPEDFSNADLVLKNPAVPENSKYLEIARKNKVPIETDIGIFFELCPAPIIGATGTKGKSTTVSLIAKILSREYENVFLAGNIRTSVLEKINKIKKEDLIVLELSSWQLAGLRPHQKSPHWAVITNILPDHLNRYKNMAEYLEDKKQIFKWQKKGDYLVLNYDDEVVRAMAPEAKRSEIFYYSQQKQAPNFNGVFLDGEKIFFGSEEKEICSLSDIQLLGRHNIGNVLASVTLAKILDISRKSIKKALNQFKGLEGRLELVRTLADVKFVNDTAATMPEASLAALDSFSVNGQKKIILIAGGADKNLDFAKLAEGILKMVKVLVLLDGTATAKLIEAVKKKIELSSYGEFKIIGPLQSMKEAVEQARSQSEPGDIVLLSPACASFGLFRHEFERGEAFNQAVEKL